MTQNAPWWAGQGDWYLVAISLVSVEDQPLTTQRSRLRFGGDIDSSVLRPLKISFSGELFFSVSSSDWQKCILRSTNPLQIIQVTRTLLTEVKTRAPLGCQSQDSLTEVKTKKRDTDYFPEAFSDQVSWSASGTQEGRGEVGISHFVKNTSTLYTCTQIQHSCSDKRSDQYRLTIPFPLPDRHLMARWRCSQIGLFSERAWSRGITPSPASWSKLPQSGPRAGGKSEYFSEFLQATWALAAPGGTREGLPQPGSTCRRDRLLAGLSETVAKPSVVCPMHSETKQTETSAFGAEEDLLQDQARMGSWCSEDPDSPVAFRPGLLKTVLAERVVGCVSSSRTFSFRLVGGAVTRWCFRSLASGSSWSSLSACSQQVVTVLEQVGGLSFLEQLKKAAPNCGFPLRRHGVLQVTDLSSDCFSLLHGSQWRPLRLKVFVFLKADWRLDPQAVAFKAHK